MNVDEIGEYLEHQGLSDDEIDAYFEHVGVKGMHWGVRKPTPISKGERKLNLQKSVISDAKTKKRIATGVAAIATYALARNVPIKAMGATITLNKRGALLATAATAKLVNSMMEVHGAKRLANI